MHQQPHTAMNGRAIAAALAILFFATGAAPAAQPTTMSQQDCRSLALVNIGPPPDGSTEFSARNGRCRVFVLQGESPLFPGKRAAWVFDGDGDLLAEFYAPFRRRGESWLDTDLGLCSFRGGAFKTSTCSWSDWKQQANQM